jgi:hypothetical protein
MAVQLVKALKKLLALHEVVGASMNTGLKLKIQHKLTAE